MVTIRNVTKEQIEKALEQTNTKFEDNIIFNRFDQTGKNFAVTLKVKSSSCSGARIGFSGKKMAIACWHVYGTFFDEIFKVCPNAVVISMGEKITAEYGNWQDKQVGSIVDPRLYSEMCHCED